MNSPSSTSSTRINLDRNSLEFEGQDFLEDIHQLGCHSIASTSYEYNQLNIVVGEHYILNTASSHQSFISRNNNASPLGTDMNQPTSEEPASETRTPFPTLNCDIVKVSSFKNISSYLSLTFFMYEEEQKHLFRYILHPNVELIVLNDQTDHSSKLLQPGTGFCARYLFAQNRVYLHFKKLLVLISTKCNIIRENVFALSIEHDNYRKQCHLERIESLKIHVNFYEAFEQMVAEKTIYELKYMLKLIKRYQNIERSYGVDDQGMPVHQITNFHVLLRWLREDSLQTLLGIYAISLDFLPTRTSDVLYSLENSLLCRINIVNPSV